MIKRFELIKWNAGSTLYLIPPNSAIIGVWDANNNLLHKDVISIIPFLENVHITASQHLRDDRRIALVNTLPVHELLENLDYVQNSFDMRPTNYLTTDLTTLHLLICRKY